MNPSPHYKISIINTDNYTSYFSQLILFDVDISEIYVCIISIF
jgi:hypothetical protein